MTTKVFCCSLYLLTGVIKSQRLFKNWYIFIYFVLNPFLVLYYGLLPLVTVYGRTETISQNDYSIVVKVKFNFNLKDAKQLKIQEPVI